MLLLGLAGLVTCFMVLNRHDTRLVLLGLLIVILVGIAVSVLIWSRFQKEWTTCPRCQEVIEVDDFHCPHCSERMLGRSRWRFYSG